MIVFLFWMSLAILFYCYSGYGMLVFLLTSFRKIFAGKRKNALQNDWSVTLVVTAYNEREVLQQKIKNILELNYPFELLQVIFVTDGSADGSDELIRQHPSFRLMHQPERKGKYAAIKRAMAEVNTNIVVFTDANSMLNKESIQKIVAHYNDERVGGVAGEKKIICNGKNSAVGQAEGWYWKYESYMKKLDATLYTVVGAAGELFSIRTNLFRALGDDLLLDDFIISMQVCLQGYKIEYEPMAFATELPSVSLIEEEKRKIRIAAGAYQSVALLRNQFQPFKDPLLYFQYISRRVLKWIYCPLMLVFLLLTNIIIALTPLHSAFFEWSLYAQLSFYGLAIIGAALASTGRSWVLFTIPFYFVFMNYCLAKGFFRYVNGKQSVLWEKSLREVYRL